MLDVEVIDDPAAAMTTPGPEAGPFAGRDGRAGLGGGAGRPGGAAPAEGQLSSARPGEARPGGGRGTTQVGRIDRAPAGCQGGVVRRLAGGPRPDRERPGQNARSSVSAGYLIALGARVVEEVSQLLRRSRETGKRLATLSIDTEIRFRSAGGARRVQQGAGRHRRPTRRALPRRNSAGGDAGIAW